jgi:hypothetical protein
MYKTYLSNDRLRMIQIIKERMWQIKGLKYDKQDQRGKAAFNERNPYMTQQQEPVARSHKYFDISAIDLKTVMLMANRLVSHCQVTIDNVLRKGLKTVFIFGYIIDAQMTY